MRHLVIDVQILMIASGLSNPPDDGAAIRLLKAMDELDTSRVVWDSGGAIRAQYESKLRPETFGKDWLVRMLLRDKIVPVARDALPKRARIDIEDTGLVGEDLHYYVRTTAKSPDRKLVSQDSDYDVSTRAVLRKSLDIRVLDSREGAAFVHAED